MDEDAFDRAVRRERELRARLAAGEIDEEELSVLREFDEADLILTLDQARRLVDEGAEPSAVAELVRHFPAVGVDEAISLVVDYDLEASLVADLVDAGTPRNLGERDLRSLFDHELSPELIELAVRVGFEVDPVKALLALSERLFDITETLESIDRVQLSGLTVEQVATIADYEINPEVVRRLLAGDPQLSVDRALRLLLGDDAPSERRPHNANLAVGIDAAVDAARIGVRVARDVARAFTVR